MNNQIKLLCLQQLGSSKQCSLKGLVELGHRRAVTLGKSPAFPGLSRPQGGKRGSLALLWPPGLMGITEMRSSVDALWTETTETVRRFKTVLMLSLARNREGQAQRRPGHCEGHMASPMRRAVGGRQSMTQVPSKCCYLSTGYILSTRINTCRGKGSITT